MKITQPNTIMERIDTNTRIYFIENDLSKQLETCYYINSQDLSRLNTLTNFLSSATKKTPFLLTPLTSFVDQLSKKQKIQENGKVITSDRDTLEEFYKLRDNYRSLCLTLPYKQSIACLSVIHEFICNWIANNDNISFDTFVNTLTQFSRLTTLTSDFNPKSYQYLTSFLADPNPNNLPQLLDVLSQSIHNLTEIHNLKNNVAAKGVEI